MIYSFCIKSNNIIILDYLLDNFEKINLNNLFLSRKKFKIYENLIIHYSGDMPNLFYNYVSNILSDCIINLYEPKLINNILNYNYFYFSDSEKEFIKDSCIDCLSCEKYNYRKNVISLAILKYIMSNRNIILDGFINFRLKDYINILEELIDICIEDFIVKREYNEFVSLLNVYVNSKPSNTDMVHLIYANNEAYIFDKNYNLIKPDDNIFTAKYLSDISFNANDYALNTLLNLLPNKINIHLLQLKDEFINTLELIFKDRLAFCQSCKFCEVYKNIPKFT